VNEIERLEAQVAPEYRGPCWNEEGDSEIEQVLQRIEGRMAAQAYPEPWPPTIGKNPKLNGRPS